MHRSRALSLFFILVCLLSVAEAEAQQTPNSLRLGTPIERTLERGQAHSFTVNLEQDQYLQLVVDQRGIDVIVRVFSPAGKAIGEFDSPNGTEGPENVSLVAVTPGPYRIDVAPLDQMENVAAGRYEIRVIELRHATDLELQAGKNQEVLKEKGLALLVEIIGTLPDLHLVQTRVSAQLRAAQLLWPSDEKRAAQLVAEAMDGVKEYLASTDDSDQEYYQHEQIAAQLRQQIIQTLAPHDPEAALNFLRATRGANSSEESSNRGQPNFELQLELQLASQLVTSDPKRALQIAEDSLKRGYSSHLVNTLANLRNKDPEMAAQLAREIAAKLQKEKLLQNSEAAYLAINLLQFARSPARRNQRSTTTEPPRGTEPLLSGQEYRDLFQKTVADALAYTPAAGNFYSSERSAAQNLLNSLKSVPAEVEAYAPESIQAIEKKTIELAAPDPQNALWQKYQTTINSSPLDIGLEAAGQAPREIKDQLYQQLAAKAAAAGDIARARQILTDHVMDPSQRRQMLSNMDQQAIYAAVAKARIEEALRLLGALRPKERSRILSQLLGQIGPGRKRAAALNLLELARSLLGESAQATDQEQMSALIGIGRAFSRYDAKRGFEIIEPLLDQFNEMSAAAVTLNGFGQEYYQGGELLMQNGNSLANAANQLSGVLGTLASVNFERARTDADRIRQPEVRLAAYLAIAQQVIQGNDPGINYRSRQ